MAVIEREAERDAHDVAELLTHLGLPSVGPGKPPVRLPRSFLLGLAVATRLSRWESHGIYVHREQGLPAANEVLREVVEAAQRADAARAEAIASMSPTVVGVGVRRLAWEGQSLFGTEVVLGDVADEDVLLDALAAYLWANRHAGRER